MEKKTIPNGEVPVWARADAFPHKPDSADYGYFDRKGNSHPAASEDELVEKVTKSRHGVGLVWIPQQERLVVPESISALHSPLRVRMGKNASHDISDGFRMSLIFGAMMLWTLYAAWKNSNGKISAIYSHQLTGLTALLLLIFGLIPLYEGWKMRRHLARAKTSDLLDEVPDAQFDAWLHRQKVPVSYFLLGCLLLVGISQLYLDWGSSGLKPSIVRAGLLKQEALRFPMLADGVAWWRMFTAPMLHGNIIHLLMNSSGILYLGRRTEILARWPHLLIVFALAMWVGSLASFYWLPNKISVGASGGLMGLLGFMLVFEMLHVRLVPKPARRRLLAGAIMMGVIGLLGISFIDNAAHAGGLIAGMIYAGIVFPPSASFHRPEAMLRDKVVGIAAAAVIVTAALFACTKILT